MACAPTRVKAKVFCADAGMVERLRVVMAVGRHAVCISRDFYAVRRPRCFFVTCLMCRFTIVAPFHACYVVSLSRASKIGSAVSWVTDGGPG